MNELEGGKKKNIKPNFNRNDAMVSRKDTVKKRQGTGYWRVDAFSSCITK